MSSHGHGADVSVPEIRLGPKAASVERISGVVGGLGLLLCAAGVFQDHQRFFQSYLFAFLYWGGFAFGSLGVLLLNNVVGGKWGVTSRRFFEAQMRTMPLVLVFFVVLLFGLKDLYAWTWPVHVAANAFLRHKQAYLNVPFFLIRSALYFAIMLFIGWRINKWTDLQDKTGDPKIQDKLRRFSAPALLLFVLTITFAYIDWVMSADTQFYSTVFGALIMFGNVQATFSLTILTMILTSKEDRFGGRINAPILHDLGKLLFAFTIFWTYLSASQLIIVWPANLPQEITWYLDRTHGFWKVLAAFVGLTMFAIPFLALLSQARKKDPRRLIRVAAFILVINAIYMFWVVEPTFRSTSASTPLHTNPGFTVYWTDAAAFLALGGIWLYVFIGQLRRRPLLPLHDPRVMAALPEEVIA